MGKQIMSRIVTRGRPKAGAGGGKAVAERLVQNGRGGRFTGTGTLTKKQIDFVRDFVKNGGNGTAALRSAGYSTAHPGKQLYRLLNCPVIRHAIHQERDKLIGGKLANEALAVLGELMHDKATPAPVRYQSARTILQMAGHGGADRPEAAAPVDRPLVELSLEELEAFVKDGMKLLHAVSATSSQDEHPTPVIGVGAGSTAGS